MTIRKRSVVDEVNIIATKKLAEASKKNPVFKNVETEEKLPKVEEEEVDYSRFV